MDASEIRAMSDEELAASLESARQEVFNLRFQHATGQLADPTRMRLVRRDIARIKTVQRERQLWAQYESARSDGEEG